MFYRDVLIESRERNTFMSKELQIRNSTVDFLVFTRDAGEDGIEVRVQCHVTIPPLLGVIYRSGSFDFSLFFSEICIWRIASTF